MKNLILVILISTIFFPSLLMGSNNLLPVEIYFREKHINIKTRTYNGWIRVFLSTSKTEQYDIDLSNSKIKDYVLELKYLNSKRIKGKL